MVMFIPCFIIEIVFYYKIKKYDLSRYDCSDSATNELIKKVAEDDGKQIIYVAINVILDLFQAAINFCAILIGIILMLKDKLKENHNEQLERNEQRNDNGNENIDINQNNEMNNIKIPLNKY